MNRPMVDSAATAPFGRALDVTLRHERASATPRAEAPARPSGALAAAQVPAVDVDASLPGTQRWFARAVTTPEHEQAPAGAGEVDARLTAGPRLSASERLAIYRRGYHLRLVECLADDYPAVEHALGEETFRDLCALYIQRHPSGGPNLNFFGRHMQLLCRGEADSLLGDDERRDFVADLAALEWAIVEVIHAPSSNPLTLEGLNHVPPGGWASARLVSNTAVRILRFDFPVNAYFQAYREGAAPEWPARGASMTVVYRSGPTVWRMDLTPPMFDVLAALLAGETLGASLAHAEHGLEGVGPEEAMRRVSHWFREWVGSGLFARVDVSAT